MPGGTVRKICLLGDGAVGKTSLIRRFVFDEFRDEYISTFGTKVTKKIVETPGSAMTIMIWDILGQKGHEALHSAYYRGASGALVVCDLTRRETFSGMDRWISSLESVVGPTSLVLLGNKCDLDDRSVSESALEKKSAKLGCPFFLASAKTGENVEAAFDAIARLLAGGGGRV